VESEDEESEGGDDGDDVRSKRYTFRIEVSVLVVVADNSVRACFASA
jgi:hypothetical protein